MSHNGECFSLSAKLAICAAAVMLAVAAVFGNAMVKQRSRCLIPASGWLMPVPSRALTGNHARPHKKVEFSTIFSPPSDSVSLAVFTTGELRGMMLNGSEITFPPGSGAVVALPVRKDTQNALSLSCEYSYGPPLIRPILSGVGGLNWRVSTEEGAGAAIAADDTLPYPVPQRSPLQKLGGVLPALLSFAVLGMAIAFLYEKQSAMLKRPVAVRALIACMAALALYFLWGKCLSSNQLQGFDAKGHISYIMYLLNNHVLPHPADFWQAYQPPLFYALSALLGAVWSAATGTLPVQLFKVLPWLAATGNVVVSYLIAREIFGKGSLRNWCAAVCAFLLPMNIYMAAFISNESLAAFVSGCALLLAFKITGRGGGWRSYVALGVVAGLALLSKYTFIAFLPLVLVFLSWRSFQAREGKAAPSLLKPLLALAVTLCVAGWFYLRTRAAVGSFMVEQSELFGIWQLPGFRTLSYFTGFGEVLRQPFISSSFSSFWDALYATLMGDGLLGGMSVLPGNYLWNMDYAGAVYLLALPLVPLFLAGWCGFIYSFLKQPDTPCGMTRGLAAASLCVAGLLLVHLALFNPSYAMVKSFYALLVMGPLCAAVAEGICWFYGRLRGLWLKLLFCGWLGGLAGGILLAYYIIPPGVF